MESAIDPSSNHKTDGPGRDVSFLRGDGAIDEIDPRGVMANARRIEEVPRLAIRVNLPAADEARVKKKKPFVAGIRDLAVALCDEHGIALMQCEPGRAYGYSKGHWLGR